MHVRCIYAFKHKDLNLYFFPEGVRNLGYSALGIQGPGASFVHKEEKHGVVL